MNIPDTDYRIELDSYHGPLDLLLLLVKRHEIDLNDIPIAVLTDQYIAHLQLLEKIDINTAGEFLVMAATLLEIKSAMLAPDMSSDQGDQPDQSPNELLDPRYELVQQLLAYKRFKDAAMDLEDQRDLWEQRYPLLPAKDKRDLAEAGNAPNIELDLEDVSVMDLCEAFGHILNSIGQQRADHEVVYDDTPIYLHAEDIIDRLTRDGAMTLESIFIGRATRSEMIGLFLATLELVRSKRVRVIQPNLDSSIALELCTQQQQQAIAAQEEAITDWRDPETGEVQYDWPSAQSRDRAARRMKMRLNKLKNKPFVQPKEADTDTNTDTDLTDGADEHDPPIVVDGDENHDPQ